MHTYIHSYPHTNQSINVKIQTISKYLLYTIVLIINIVLHHITNCYVLYTIYSITIYYIMAVPWLRKEYKACSHPNQQQADLTCPLLSHSCWQKAILMIKQQSKTCMGKEHRSSCVHESLSMVLQRSPRLTQNSTQNHEEMLSIFIHMSIHMLIHMLLLAFIIGFFLFFSRFFF